MKKTDKNKWTSTGNSVLESTRIKNVKRIYIFFGKLASPVDFDYRLYEDCLAEIVVTHSPRYRINMKLEKGNSIFDEMGISYEDLRNEREPLRYFTEYYKKKKKGSEPWWISKTTEEETSPVLRLWGDLENSEKEIIKKQIMILFPEIFSNSTTKYNRIILWLVKKHSVINASLRDEFTAGGQRTIIVGKKSKKVPKIFFYLKENIKDIHKEIKIILENNLDEVKYYWEDDAVDSENIVKKWSLQVSAFAIKNKKVNKEVIESIVKI